MKTSGILGWILAAAAVSFLSICVNLGGAWMGDPARWEHAVITGVYVLFWLVFTLAARTRPTLAKCCVAMAALTLLTTVMRLLVTVGGLDLLMLPALLFTLFFSVPLYGLRFLGGWTALDVTVLTVSILWLICTAKQLHKH